MIHLARDKAGSECLKLGWDEPTGTISGYKVISYNKNNFNAVEFAY